VAEACISISCTLQHRRPIEKAGCLVSGDCFLFLTRRFFQRPRWAFGGEKVLGLAVYVDVDGGSCSVDPFS
jgi:hypothetical protein